MSPGPFRTRRKAAVDVVTSAIGDLFRRLIFKCDVEVEGLI